MYICSCYYENFFSLFVSFSYFVISNSWPQAFSFLLHHLAQMYRSSSSSCSSSGFFALVVKRCHKGQTAFHKTGSTQLLLHKVHHWIASTVCLLPPPKKTCANCSKYEILNYIFLFFSVFSSKHTIVTLISLAHF